MFPLSQYDDADESVVETIHERRPTITPADLVLIVLPVFLFAGWATGVLSGVSLVAALALAALPALATLGYALFYAPPSARAG